MIRLSPELNETIQQGGTLVVPSRQRAHAARLAHAAAELDRGHRVWKSPDILTTEAWLIREIEKRARTTAIPRLLSPAEEWLLWRQCTAAATGDLDLVNRGALSENLRRSAALAADYQIDLRKLKDAGCAEPGLLRDVQRAFDERCEALGAATVASITPQLHEAVRSQSGADAGPLVFAGFTEVTPRMAALGAQKRTSGRAAASSPSAVVAADEWEELEAIAEWCKRQVEHRPNARVLVILPGSPGMRERLATLIRQAIAPTEWLETEATESLVVVEGGKPLPQIPAIRHALSTLSWLSGQPAEFEDFSEWLRAPYWTTVLAASRARLDVWIRERGQMRLRLRELASTLRGAPASCADASKDLTDRIAAGAAKLGDASASPREWSSRFGQALTAFGWPGDRPRTSGDQQSILRFHELLDEFGQLATAFTSMSRDTALQCLTDLATRTAFQPADEDPTVTVSSTLADPVVQYDGLWVAGLHSEAFPQPVQPDPFLPLGVQVAAGIPAASAVGRLAEAHALIQAWRASADELVLSAPARSEDLELLPSPLLAQWMAPASRPVGGPQVQSTAWLPHRMHRNGLLESMEDSSGPTWNISQPLPSGTRSLELQNDCPFRAFAELRLGSRPLDAPEPGIGADLRGNLLHASLRELWRRLGDSRALLARSEEALATDIAECVAEAAKETFALTDTATGANAHPPALAREIRRTVRLIGELCTLERGRAPFHVEGTEFQSTLKIAGGELRLRIDRIDALESGGRAILDYKSGRPTTADWYGDRPSHPQLLAYLAALGDDVVAMATVNVTAREVRFDGIAESPKLLPKVRGVEPPEGGDDGIAWEVRRREWLARVEGLAAAFLRGHAAVDPKPGACEYCHVSSVCRISERNRPESDDA